ncbi:MAG: serine hydrolase domain-containing protein [Pseudomonadota bacterium]
MLKTTLRLGTAVVIFAWFSPSFAAVPVEERIARIENGLLPRVAIQGQSIPALKIADRMATLKVPGVSVAVFNNGAIEWARAYGVAEAGSERKVTTETLFQAASVSKPVAAMAALRLVEQGKLSLDQPVNNYLGPWKLPKGAQTKDHPVTLRNLLNHSAGTTVHGFRGYAAGEPVPTLTELLDGKKPANSDAVRVAKKPDSEWNYSGGGISIAQLMMNTASGQPFATLMHDTVLAPLDMKHSTFAQPLPPALQAAAASGHDGAGVPIKGKWHSYPEQAAAGLWTTPSDLALFAIELHKASKGKSDKVLTPAMAKTMLTRLKGDYGLGMFVETPEGRPMFNHGGTNVGFQAMLIAFNDNGQGAVVMSNGDNGQALNSDILRAISAQYGWTDFRVTYKALAKVDPAVFASYAGNYAVRNTTIVVTREGTRLFVKAAPLGPDRHELLPTSATSYFTLTDRAEFSFEKAAGGKFDLVIQLGDTFRAKRVK